MHYIDGGLASEIRERVSRLGSINKSFLILPCSNRAKKLIRKGALRHSYDIEYPGQVLNARRSDHGRFKKEVRKLEQTYNWARNYFKSKKVFDENLLFEIGRGVNPESGYLRTQGFTHIQGCDFALPSPYKLKTMEIPFLLDLVNSTLQEAADDPVQKIIASIHAHYHIARIHPFYDGNGRTARLAQWVILDHSNLPLPVIPSTERSTYLDCLNACDHGYYDRRNSGKTHGVSKGENIFYNFLAGKINTSLEQVLCALR